MTTEREIIRKTEKMIDELKSVCSTYGLGNASSEYKIITEIFLYKYLNDKSSNSALIEYNPNLFARGAYRSIVSLAFAICLSLDKYFSVLILCNLSANFIRITLMSFPIAKNIFL